MNNYVINDEDSVTFSLGSSNSVINVKANQTAELAIQGGTSIVGIDVFIDRIASGNGTGTGFVSQAQWLIVEKNAGENIEQLKMIRFQDAETVVYAKSNSTLIEARPVGITLTSTLAGGKVKVLVLGLIENPAFNYTAGTLLFLGQNGSITNIVPTSGYSVVIGEVLAPGVINLSIRTPIRL
jgi:hypothetical protein